MHFFSLHATDFLHYIILYICRYTPKSPTLVLVYHSIKLGLNKYGIFIAAASSVKNLLASSKQCQNHPSF